jgi:hypothetical protein
MPSASPNFSWLLLDGARGGLVVLEATFATHLLYSGERGEVFICDTPDNEPTAFGFAFVAGLLRLRRSPLLANPPTYVFPAAGAVHVRERVGLPEVSQRQDSLLRLVGPRVLGDNIDKINIQNVEN